MRNLKLSGSHVCSEFYKLIRSGTKYILSAFILNNIFKPATREWTLQIQTYRRERCKKEKV
jgi:hypothetical protein